MQRKVRELVDLGRVMLAIEKYRKSEASIEKAAKIAGVSISKIIDIFKENGVEANPAHPVLRLHKLKGKFPGKYAVFINFAYRIVIAFVITENEIIPVDIGSHDEVY